MSTENLTTEETENEELEITRLIDAPVEKVYNAWTKAKQIAVWWGPKDFTNPVCEINLMPAGEIKINMKGPDGVTYPMAGIFLEIVEPEKLVFTTTAFQNDDLVWQLEVFNTVSFENESGKTKLTFYARIVKATEAVAASVEGMEKGWNECLDKLTAFVTAKN